MSSRRISIPYGAGRSDVTALNIGGAVSIPAEAISDVTVSRILGGHEEVHLATSFGSRNPNEWRDQPATLSYGRGNGGPVRVSGYITDATKAQLVDGTPTLSVEMLGITKNATEVRQRVWVNKTITELAPDILSGSSVKVVVERDEGIIIPRLAQTTESDWATLVRAARLAGMELTIVNGTVRIFSPYHVLESTPPKATFAIALDANDENGHVLAITASELSDIYSRESPQRGYLNGDRAERTESTGSFKNDMFLATPEFARSVQRYTDRSLEYWNQGAEARLRGRADLYPGDTIAINTGAAKSTDLTTDGIWIVTKVVHSLTTSAFQSQVSLARDKVRYTTVNIAPQLANPNSYSTTSVVSTNNRWRSF